MSAVKTKEYLKLNSLFYVTFFDMANDLKILNILSVYLKKFKDFFAYLTKKIQKFFCITKKILFGIFFLIQKKTINKFPRKNNKISKFAIFTAFSSENLTRNIFWPKKSLTE